MVGSLLVIEIIFVIDWRDLYFSFVNLWKGDWMDLMGNEIEEKKKKKEQLQPTYRTVTKIRDVGPLIEVVLD